MYYRIKPIFLTLNLNKFFCFHFSWEKNNWGSKKSNNFEKKEKKKDLKCEELNHRF